MLRTKAMREKEEQREMRKYTYTLLRVRLPDGCLLQGTCCLWERAVRERNRMRPGRRNLCLAAELGAVWVCCALSRSGKLLWSEVGPGEGVSHDL